MRRRRFWPETKSLCSISFERDAKRPTRVDNEAKACLDDIALSAQQDPNAKLAVVAIRHAKADRGSEVQSTKRCCRARCQQKDYLVTEKGIDASRISVYTGTAGTKSAATTLIPDGATLTPRV